MQQEKSTYSIGKWRKLFTTTQRCPLCHVHRRSSLNNFADVTVGPSKARVPTLQATHLDLLELLGVVGDSGGSACLGAVRLGQLALGRGQGRQGLLRSTTLSVITWLTWLLTPSRLGAAHRSARWFGLCNSRGVQGHRPCGYTWRPCNYSWTRSATPESCMGLHGYYKQEFPTRSGSCRASYKLCTPWSMFSTGTHKNTGSE
jgi:hypothetical protein